MSQLSEEQIQAVIDWMNTWEQLRGTAIPIRFEEDFSNKNKSVKCLRECASRFVCMQAGCQKDRD